MKYTKSEFWTDIFEGSEPLEGAPPTSGLVLDVPFTASRIIYLDFLSFGSGAISDGLINL